MVASFGFDVDFVLRRMTSGRKYDKIVLLAIRTSEEAHKRVEKAYHALSYVCKSAGVECVLETISLSEAFRNIYTIVKREIEKAEHTEIFLTGGPRMLVVMLLLVLLLLPDEYLRKVDIVVEGEGFDCALEVSAALYARRVKLDERSKEVLLVLDAVGKATLSDVARFTDMPRSSVYRKLKEMIDQGLVELDEVAATYSPRRLLNVVCRGA